MKFTVYHYHNKPIDAEHRELAAKEWREYADSLLLEKPKAEDIDKWREIEKLLNEKEDEIRSKYPCKAEWNFNNLDELVAVLNTTNSLSLCKENDSFVIYIAD